MNNEFVSVPRELTPEMREAFHESYERYEDGSGECPDSQWRAMLRVAPQPAAQHQGDQFTYSSKQETNCAGCGIRKHTPLRVDAMGGYVCLTCIDQKLEALLSQPEHQGEPVAVLYGDGSVLTKADCGDAFETCCKVETPLFTHADTGEVERLRAQLAETQRISQEEELRANRYSQQLVERGWTCFHCGEHFNDADSAAVHFGTHEIQRPACLIDAAEYRSMEERVRECANEDSELHRQLHRQASEHRRELQRAEDRGYAKGIAETSVPKCCGACGGCTNGCQLDKDSPPSAPVDQDEYLAFLEALEQHGVDPGLASELHCAPPIISFYKKDVQLAWQMWQSRAAMGHKP